MSKTPSGAGRAPGAERARGVDRRQFLRQSAWAAGGVVALGLTACGAPTGRTGAPGAAAQEAAPAAAGSPMVGAVRIAVLPYLASWPLFVAMDKGFFAGAGVEIRMPNLDAGATALSAMHGGSLDLAPVVNVSSTIQAIEQGLDVQFISNLNHESKLTPNHAYVVVMVPPDSPITSARDFEGKRVADNSIRGTNQLLFDRWLKNNGVDPTKKQHVNMPTSAMEGALKSHLVDAVITAEPFLSTYVKNGSAKVLAYYATEVMPALAYAVQITTKAWADEHAGVLTAYLHGYNRAVDFLVANEQGEALDIMAKWTKTDPALARQMHLQEFRKGMDAASLQQIADLMLEEGYISRPIDVSQYVSPLVTTEG